MWPFWLFWLVLSPSCSGGQSCSILLLFFAHAWYSVVTCTFRPIVHSTGQVPAIHFLGLFTSPSLLVNPLLPLHIKNMHRTKHGSDSGVRDGLRACVCSMHRVFVCA